MNGRDVVRLVLLSAPRRPIVTKHAHRTFGVPLRVNCSCATRKQLRGPLLSVKNASPCADLELATHKGDIELGAGPCQWCQNKDELLLADHEHVKSLEAASGWRETKRWSVNATPPFVFSPVS